MHQPKPKPFFHIIDSNSESAGAQLAEKFTALLRAALKDGYLPIPATFHYGDTGPQVMCSLNPQMAMSISDICLITTDNMLAAGNELFTLAQAGYNAYAYCFLGDATFAIVIKPSRIMQGGPNA